MFWRAGEKVPTGRPPTGRCLQLEAVNTHIYTVVTWKTYPRSRRETVPSDWTLPGWPRESQSHSSQTSRQTACVRDRRRLGTSDATATPWWRRSGSSSRPRRSRPTTTLRRSAAPSRSLAASRWSSVRTQPRSSTDIWTSRSSSSTASLPWSLKLCNQLNVWRALRRDCRMSDKPLSPLHTKHSPSSHPASIGIRQCQTWYHHRKEATKAKCEKQRRQSVCKSGVSLSFPPLPYFPSGRPNPLNPSRGLWAPLTWGSGRSPTAKRFMVHFQLKIMLVVTQNQLAINHLFEYQLEFWTDTVCK